MKLVLVILIGASFIACLEGFTGLRRKPGYGPGNQHWGWYRIRKVAHLFFWLFYTQAPDVQSPYDRPLVIYLSGGPGVSSTGFGNFAEVGPLSPNGTRRQSSWVNHVNLLFIDNPVGTGYSYVDFGNPLAQNNEEIGADMVRLLKKFYNKHPEFSSVPMYIFGEGYGGKMAVEIAKQLDAAIKNNELDADFRGVGLGAPWISPIDSCKTWGSYLFVNGLVDRNGREKIDEAAQLLQMALIGKHYRKATRLFLDLEKVASEQTKGVDFNNILNPVKNHKRSLDFRRHVKKAYSYTSLGHQGKVINDLMQNEVRLALRIPENNTYEHDGHWVFTELKEDFMKPVTSVVEELLNSTNLKVAVYNGQLDAIVSTFGTLQWIDRLQWPGASGWERAPSEALAINDIIQGYARHYGNLYYYSIDRAGDSVPIDNPEAGIEVLRRVTEFDKKIEPKPDSLTTTPSNFIDFLKDIAGGIFNP